MMGRSAAKYTPSSNDPNLQVVKTVQFTTTPLFHDSAFLYQKYVNDGPSIKQIETEISPSRATEQKGLITANIKICEPHQHHARPSQPRFGQKVIHDKAKRHTLLDIRYLKQSLN